MPPRAVVKILLISAFQDDDKGNAGWVFKCAQMRCSDHFIQASRNFTNPVEWHLCSCRSHSVQPGQWWYPAPQWNSNHQKPEGLDEWHSGSRPGWQASKGMLSSQLPKCYALLCVVRLCCTLWSYSILLDLTRSYSLHLPAVKWLGRHGAPYCHSCHTLT